MKKSNILICFVVLVFFAVAQLGIAYALDNHTTADLDHAASILTNNTHLNEGDDSTLQTEGYGAHGVYISGDNSSWTFGDNSTITTESVTAHGVYVRGSNSQITFGDNATIAAGSYGTLASDSQITFGDNATITSGGRGFDVAKNSHITFGDNATITADEMGTHTDGDSKITFGDNATITAGKHGAYTSYFSQITFGDNATITSGETGAAAYDSQITFGDNATITSAENGAAAYDSQITFGDNATITARWIGADAWGDSHITFGDNATITSGETGAHAFRDAQITFGDNATITSAWFGAHASYDAQITFGDNANITTSGSWSHGASVYGNMASIKFNGDTKITTSASDAYALFAEEGTIYSAQASQYTISGDMVADIGTIDLDMSVGSRFTGKTDAGSGNITLNMAGSRWDVTGDSNLTYLSLGATMVDYSNSVLGTTITTDTLDGPGGTFILKTDIVNETADMLFITNTMNGSQHNITVRNNGSAATTGNEVVDLVDTADATGSFQLTHAVDVGAWQYSLRQVSGGSYGSLWQLYATGRSTITEVVIGDLYSDYLLNYAETQTLIQRLGDLRQTPKQSGFWFKAHGGNFESSSMWTAKSFDMDYWGVQLGYDRKVEIDWDGTVYAGVMFGYGKGDTNYASGGSDIESKTVGVYGTFVHPNGFFADLVLKYRWSDSDFNATDSAGTLVTGRDASSKGFGASLELGQRIPLRKSEEQKMGWYVEPQVQLSLQRLGGGFFHASNGLHIGAEHYTSLLGRLGMLVGYETENRNFYAKASKVKEFRGDMTILANSDPIDISFASSWWVYGLGYTARINDKNSIYVDLERSSGGLFTQKWALQAGWRMEF